MSERVALFDFDGTLTRGDTLLPFLKAAIGPASFYCALALASPWLVGYALGVTRNDVAKQKLLTESLGARSVSDLAEQGRTFAQRAIPAMLRPSMMARLRKHQTDGCLCVLVSASLDLYLEPWAQAEGFADVICSRLVTDADGRVTGAFLDANCHGEEKVRRIRLWLKERAAKAKLVAAYGDTPGDLPMLALAERGYWVRNDHLRAMERIG